MNQKKIYSNINKTEYKKAVNFFKQNLKENFRGQEVLLVKQNTLFFRTFLLYLANHNQALNYAKKCCEYHNKPFPPYSNGHVTPSYMFSYSFSYEWHHANDLGSLDYCIKKFIHFYFENFLKPNKVSSQLIDSLRWFDRNAIVKSALSEDIFYCDIVRDFIPING